MRGLGRQRFSDRNRVYSLARAPPSAPLGSNVAGCEPEHAGVLVLGVCASGGMMARTVAQKMGIKAGTRALFVHAPEAALAAIELPRLEVPATCDGEFGYIHLFVISQAEMEAQFPRLRAHLQPAGSLWVSWPKGRQLGTDLILPDVIRIGYRHGLVVRGCAPSHHGHRRAQRQWRQADWRWLLHVDAVTPVSNISNDVTAIAQDAFALRCNDIQAG